MKITKCDGKCGKETSKIYDSDWSRVSLETLTPKENRRYEFDFCSECYPKIMAGLNDSMVAK